MSAMEAPPVASAGLAMNPVKNRNARMTEKLCVVTIGTLNMTNMASPMIYTGLRPYEAISWRGVRNIGPIP